jgi:hypothetical protein
VKPGLFADALKTPEQQLLEDLQKNSDLRLLGEITRNEPTPDICRAKYRYRPRQRGKNDAKDIGVCLYLARLFQLNEYYAVVPPFDKREKMSDGEILRLLEREFPDSGMVQRVRYGRLTINQLRYHYNNGALTIRMPNPIHSFRYGPRGEAVEGRYGRRPLTDEEKQQIIDRARAARQRRQEQQRKARRGWRIEWWYGDQHGESRPSIGAPASHLTKLHPNVIQKAVRETTPQQA